MGEPEESVESIKEEIERLRALPYTTDPDIATELAGLYLDLGDEIDQEPDQRIAEYEEGARIAQEALNLKEDLADAHFYYAANLGSAAYLQGILASLINLQDLTNHVTRTLELQEDHAPAHHMRGMMLEKLPWFLGGDSERALQHLQRAVEVDKYYMHARLNLGKVYLKRDMIDEAIQELQFVGHNEPPKSKRKWAQRYRPEAERLLSEIETESLPATPQ
jgi:tetratricopeptide (TPR) repeat protein